MHKQCKKFKYKGKVFILIENNISIVPGFRFLSSGVNIISINKDLPQRKKQLELHRLIKGRGLRNMQNGKKVNYN